MPTLLAMAGFATLLALVAHPVWRWVAAATGLLVVSLTARTLDAQSGEVCAMLPIGLHWAWHLLNGTLLGVLAVGFVRHGERDETPAPGARVARDGAAG